MYMKQNKGFTLIELLVVTTIIAMLAIGAFISFNSAGKSARDGRRKTDLETVRQSLVLYKAENGCYPSGNYSSATSTLTTGGFLSNPAPTDPKPSSHSYTYTPAGGACPLTFTLAVSPSLENGGAYSVVNP